MRIDSAQLAAFATRALAAPLAVAAAERPLARTGLSPGERALLAGLEDSPRAQSWLLGRAALKRLRRTLGECSDTADLSFPHPRYSLTHSGSTAVAVGHRSVSGRPRGVGVDLERDRPMRREAAGFYLTWAEQLWLDGLDTSSLRAELLRLWTVKEALFKADPRNAETRLHHYDLDHPGASKGCATGRDGLELRWASLRVDGGYLSLAIAD